jgi:hypothetical protein
VAFVAAGLLATATASAVAIDFENYPTGPVGTGASWPQDWSTSSGTTPVVTTNGALAGSQSLEFLTPVPSSAVFSTVYLDLRSTSKDYTPLGNEVQMSMLIQPGDASVSTSYPGITIRLLTDAGEANHIEFDHYTGADYFAYYNGSTYTYIQPHGFTLGDVYQVDMLLHKTTETWDLKLTDVTGGGSNVLVNLQGLGFRSTGIGSGNISFFNMASYVPAGVSDNIRVDNLNISNVPEPASLGLLGLGALALTMRRQRRDDN